MFDSQVQPVLLYGAEIWGFEKNMDIEKVHLFAMKRFLNVDSRTPNDFVYGELGRFPVYLNSYMKCIKYWLKLTRMNVERLPFRAYRMLFNLDYNGKKTWATSVRLCLNSYGFSFVWDNQGVQHISEFLRCFRQRIIDCRWQDWHDHIFTSDRFAQYRLFKTSFLTERYVNLRINRYVRSDFTKFRFGVSDIACHRFRYNVGYENVYVCRLCNLSKEDEIHFLLCCPALSDLRARFIPSKYSSDPCMFRLSLLMSTRHESTLLNLAMYIYQALQRLRIVTS